MAALRAVAPRGMTQTEVIRRARQGIEFVAAFSVAVMALSSTHRELYGLAIFVVAAAVFLGKGRHQLIMDNLGCVFILGRYVPPLRWEANVGENLSQEVHGTPPCNGSRCSFSTRNTSTGSLSSQCGAQGKRTSWQITSPGYLRCVTTATASGR